MIFRVEHRTSYSFSAPVFLEPHVLRLRPRCDGGQETLGFSLEITPQPAGQSEGLDEENCPFRLAWFSGLKERLEIVSRCRVRTLRENPFDFVPLSSAERLPLVLEEPLARRLAHCLAPGWDTAEDREAVEGLARERLAASGGETMAFLVGLNGRLFEGLDKVRRDEPGIYSPAETLSRRGGACRDIAALFMEVCRAVGLPARFVSGYQPGDPDEELNDLHGWAEVFIPGGGWRAFDPTHGLAVAERHVALCASADPRATAPVAGAFRGTGVMSGLETLVRMEIEQ